MNTGNPAQLRALVGDYESLEPIPNDEKLLGFHHQSDQYGGFLSSPMISDVQDEQIRDELLRHGFEPRDAEHITQAVCNRCNVFLTRDGGIINRRLWLETRFPAFKVKRPSEIEAEDSGCTS
jgi:hypothetical protein